MSVRLKLEKYDFGSCIVYADDIESIESVSEKNLSRGGSDTYTHVYLKSGRCYHVKATVDQIWALLEGQSKGPNNN